MYLRCGQRLRTRGAENERQPTRGCMFSCGLLKSRQTPCFVLLFASPVLSYRAGAVFFEMYVKGVERKREGDSAVVFLSLFLSSSLSLFLSSAVL
jgi:hypothetical protein